MTEPSSTPLDPAPLDPAPLDFAPAESAPAESAPAESAPAESAPAESAPAEEPVPAVTQALAALDELNQVQVDDHVAVFGRVHLLLAGALAEPAQG